MVPIRPEKRLERIRAMSSPELLDRVTVLREGMDNEALELFHAELASRGIGPDEIGAHLRDMRLKTVQHHDGLPAVCHTCGRAAVMERIEWHRLWGTIPLFRRKRYWCEEHGGTHNSPD
jgi:hypothetical protein